MMQEQMMQDLQQPYRQIDVLKVIFLFIGLGVSAYITFAISKNIMDEITKHLNGPIQ